MRLLEHPGYSPAERIVSIPTRVRIVRGEVESGERLTDGLWKLLAPTGCRAGGAEISSGNFNYLPYVHPALATQQERKSLTFSRTQEAKSPAALLLGSATIGMRHGERYTHTHATWLDGQGALRGGHLLEGATVGNVPMQVVLRAFTDVEWQSNQDPETLMPTFTPRPHPKPGPARGDPTTVVSRVRPGLDLYEAIRRICATAGYDQARVHCSLGSTVGARFASGIEVIDVDPPGVEFTRLVGTIERARSQNPVIHLVGACVDIDGRVHTGAVLPGQNAVAITFELVIQENPRDRTT